MRDARTVATCCGVTFWTWIMGLAAHANSFRQTSNVWTGGDFNYDGFVDVTDLGALATKWSAGVGNLLARSSLDALLTQIGIPLTAVPEPLTILCIPSLALFCRRRTRRATS